LFLRNCYLNFYILEYNPTTGALIRTFVDAAGTDLQRPFRFVFGPDGNLYATSYYNSRIIEFNGTTGAYIRDFVTAGSGGLQGPSDLAFGPDGNLYVVDRLGNDILRYNGQTGAFMDVFVPEGSGGMYAPEEMVFFTPTPAPSTLVMSSILLGMFGVVWSYKRLKRAAMAA
jgi:DNA-binding beta-propeller fold protein YncE